ncbi:hypothetical protein SDC9_168480 [bioreactor metagenome]|uniref:Uncharacterized protein n=1 Tax=bioreactor metagenome TaxID=1076179 RepID=A0A645G2N2_9ZZZZ
MVKPFAQTAQQYNFIRSPGFSHFERKLQIGKVFAGRKLAELHLTGFIIFFYLRLDGIEITQNTGRNQAQGIGIIGPSVSTQDEIAFL